MNTQPTHEDMSLAFPLDMEVATEEVAQKLEFRQGDRCPRCTKGRLDYDGLLNLSCTSCGYSLGGCFT